jgi:MoaA/NifB/PqqE/SkfB family radical SAM enzyme
VFCLRPFEQCYVTEDGDVHLCCPWWIAMPAGNLLARPPLEIWTGQVAQNIRSSIVDGSFRHCINCPHLPGPSGCVLDEPPRDPPTDRIHTLTASYDSTCNLRCKSCRTKSSGPTAMANLIQEMLIRSGIFSLVDRLAASGHGDPLASPLFWQLLKSLNPRDYPRLRLVLMTNGILLAPRHGRWQMLGEYAHRINEVQVSVDAATPETYAENRGGCWQDVRSAVDEVRRREIPLQLNFVVQENNLSEVVEFARWSRSVGARATYFSALENWGTFDDADYLERSVHRPAHPRHGELLDVLSSEEIQGDPRVVLAGLPRGKKK